MLMSIVSRFLKTTQKRKSGHRNYGPRSMVASSTKLNASSDVYLLSRFRIYIVWLVIFAVLSALVGRLLWIQVLYPERLIKEGNSRIIRSYTYEPARGLITDRNGKILAISVPVKSIYANPREMSNKKVTHDPEMIRKIAKIIDLTPQELFDKVKDSSRRHVRLKQYLPINKAQELEKLKVAGISITDNYQRYYPTGAINAQIVGILSGEGTGVYGVEKSFNEFLSAESMSKKAKKDLSGHIIEDLGVIEHGKIGGNLVLSIDDRLQTFAYEALEETVNKHGAESATAVMMDVKTGEILAMANYPSFDPNDRSFFDSNHARNRTITDVFEPGSTIKPFVVLAGLESGLVKWTEVFDTRSYRVNGKLITDTKKRDQSTLFEVIKNSSNTGMAQIAQRIGPQAVLSMFERFGFGTSTNSGLSGEVQGNINSSRTFWAEIDKATIGFGYGITVTPLQLASAYATLANYGARIPVTILRQVEKPSYSQVANVNDIRRMHSVLETVVSQGSGGKAAINRYRIAGKTGTAHIALNGSYADEYVASFVGFAPISNPRFVLSVVVFCPQTGSHFGGAVSGPPFHYIMTKALQLYNIPPDKNE